MPNETSVLEQVGEAFLLLHLYRGRKGVVVIANIPDGEPNPGPVFAPVNKITEITAGQEPVTTKTIQALENGDYARYGYLLTLCPNEVLGIGFSLELQQIPLETVARHVLTGASPEELAAIRQMERKTQTPKRRKPRGFGG